MSPEKLKISTSGNSCSLNDKLLDSGKGTFKNTLGTPLFCGKDRNDLMEVVKSGDGEESLVVAAKVAAVEVVAIGVVAVQVVAVEVPREDEVERASARRAGCTIGRVVPVCLAASAVMENAVSL